MDSITVYGVNVLLIDGKIEYRSIDLINDALYIELTPKPFKKGKRTDLPPNIPMFHTLYGSYLQLNNLEAYEKALTPYGFDLFMPSYLVNTNKVEYIDQTAHGCLAYFKNGQSVTVSRTKAQEYPNLFIKDSH
jgi:two-component system LytT family response regulator